MKTFHNKIPPITSPDCLNFPPKFANKFRHFRVCLTALYVMWSEMCVRTANENKAESVKIASGHVHRHLIFVVRLKTLNEPLMPLLTLLRTLTTGTFEVEIIWIRVQLTQTHDLFLPSLLSTRWRILLLSRWILFLFQPNQWAWEKSRKNTRNNLLVMTFGKVIGCFQILS